MEPIWIVAVIEGLLLLVYCIYLTWYYAAKDRTPRYVLVLTVISWFLGLMVIFIVPLDIYTVSFK